MTFNWDCRVSDCTKRWQGSIDGAMWIDVVHPDADPVLRYFREIHVHPPSKVRLVVNETSDAAAWRREMGK